jgi:hypothetical protein
MQGAVFNMIGKFWTLPIKIIHLDFLGLFICVGMLSILSTIATY